jgi:small GTP-binding protein
VQHDFNYQGEIHKLQIWDTAGQERYHSMAPIYSEGAHGALLVFDLTHRETLEHLPTWRSSLQKCRPDIPIFVVGNKNDLARERQVSWTDGSSFAEQLGFRYFETSARNGDGVDQTFEEIAQAAIELTAGKATEASNPGKPKKSGCC